MKQNIKKIEHEILSEVMHLLDKTGFESFAAITSALEDSEPSLEATLINIRNLTARYDKQDALIQVRCLMTKYNIQPDELVGDLKAH